MIVIGCGKQKLARRAPAEELYTGSLFRAARRYAEARGERWVIASGKHGLVLPGQVLDPYDQRAPLGRDALVFWGQAVVERLVGLVERPEFVEVLAGASYAKAITDELWRRGWASSEPLAGLGLGYRLSWLKRATSELGGAS